MGSHDFSGLCLRLREKEGVVDGVAVGALGAEASTVCLPVVAGFFRVNASAVQQCPAGSKCAGGNKTAVLCPKGSVARFRGANSCSDCTKGTFTASAGQTECALCPTTGTTCINGLLSFDPDTWYPPDTTTFDEDTEIHECFNDECCVRYAENTLGASA